jgi:hypothetical protein
MSGLDRIRKAARGEKTPRLNNLNQRLRVSYPR